MSDHAHDHGHDAGHHAPTNFWLKYVFSTDHKVIGIQFMFVSLLFVLLGGLLALGVRYQLAWPSQNVPYANLLPGKMTARAPEANVALWHLGHGVELSRDVEADGHTLAAGAKATLDGFPQGLGVTLRKGTVIDDNIGTRTLTSDTPARVAHTDVMADYDYKNQFVRAVPGTSVTLESGEAARLVAVERRAPDVATAVAEKRHMILPVIAAQTPVALTIDGATVETTADAVMYPKESLTSDAYLQLFTMHASIMIFFVIIPMLVGGFGNFVVPLMIGARDMAFPKLNMLSFWVSVPAGILMLISFWTPMGSAGGGWTMYPTLSTFAYSPQLGTTLWIASVGLVGFSSVVGALNYVTTIINMRAPGMTMFRMPLTVWSVLITATLALFATPVLTAAMIMLLLDRTVGTLFFSPTISTMVDGVQVTQATGGQVLMWQHLFWFYSHPAVYIMILPAMGVVSDVLATFSRKPIFGYKPMVFAICGIAGLGFIVWGHHMFQSGMNPVLGTTFMASTIMIAVPSAIKTFNWLGTLWGGNIRFTPAMLNALGFISMFVIGGLSGIFMAAAPVDIYIHDTYFIVAHIHYVLFGGSLFGIFAGVYYWFPKMFGRQMNQKWGVIHFVMTIIAFNGTFFLMHVLGIGGHPRRYASIMEYPTLEHLQPLNVFMTISAIMLGTAQLPFMYNFFVSLPRKLGRAMIALFVVALGGPMVIGLTFYNTLGKFGSIFETLFGAFVVAAPAEGDRPLGYALAMAVLAGAVYTLLVVALTWLVWFIGGKLRIPAIIERALYIVFLPAFLAPMLLKQDAYLWLGVPSLFQHAWLLVGLTALPGLIYLVLFRPQDQFGYATTDNPWHANSLEWCTTSPPPFTNFETIPTVYRGPYEFSSPAVREDYLPQPHVLPAGVVEPESH